MIQLDEWQIKVLETEGNICLRSGRQVGKTEVISILAGEEAMKAKKSILIISSTERQAYALFDRALGYLYENYKKYIKMGKDKPTKHEIKLKNGSIIRSLPTGLSGTGIRGLTVDVLIADEAAFIPEEVWTAVTPMLAVTKGRIILLSTPHGREGYFYRAFTDPAFTSFHVSSEECPRISKEFLAAEKKRMTALEYTQEYLGQFIDELKQLFPDELIRKCQLVSRRASITRGNYFLGVDVARMGGDETTYEIIQKDGKRLIHVESIIHKYTYLTETCKTILNLERQYGFKKIYIDDGGLGAGVFDYLLNEEGTKRKVVAINNSKRSLNRDETNKTKLMKEDLYSNLLRLMEQGHILLLDDDEVFLSLKSVQMEYTDRGKLKIYGSYTHVTEGLVRAAFCALDKSLNLWVRWS